MGATPTPRNAEPPPRVAVAFSGGRDSTALLHAVCRAARGCGVEVVALHVHHGLLAEADAWVRHARSSCARWRRAGAPLRLRVGRLTSAPAAGESAEAWARRERYAALATMAREEGVTLVLLAHHRRDQAETVLLQALRGAGPAGLAAMPRCAVRDGLTWVRPWLDQPREAIAAYLARHRLRAIDDPSNADARFARSRLRLEVWPSLRGSFTDVEVALAAVARRAAEARAVLSEVAAADLAVCADADGLRVADWLRLSPPRRANALRQWCGDRLAGGVPQTLVARLAVELAQCRAGRWPAPDATVVLARGRLQVLPLLAPTPHHGPVVTGIDLSRPGRWPLPDWGGAWQVSACRRGGLPAATLCAVELRPRSGGERLALSSGGIARSLKKQFQALAVPAHQRAGPLIWHGEQLLFVPGLGADARAIAPAGVVQRRLRWEPDAVPSPSGAQADCCGATDRIPNSPDSPLTAPWL